MNKIILHLDFNSFFASVEQQANPFLRGKPIAVAGKGKHSIDVQNAYKSKHSINVKEVNYHRTVVTTASIEAKRRGVKTAMSSLEARRICPELIIIPGDPRKYSEITNRFLHILKRYSDAVEQFSTDEAFADLSIACKDYFGATMIAQRIRSDIKREIGKYCTASIGIAPNKLAAKLACESCKPDGLTVIQPHQLTTFVAEQPMEAICGIGSRTIKKLHSAGITSLKTLQSIPYEVLIQEFQQYGTFLYFAAQGIGDDMVRSTKLDPKSVSHSYTFPHDLQDEALIKKHLLAICDKVTWRMRRKGYTAKTLHVHIRYQDMGGVGTQTTTSDVFRDGLSVYKTAWKLIETIRNPNYGIRLLGISLTQLRPPIQSKSLFIKQEKMYDALTALDSVQTKYGSHAWQRAATLGTVFKERASGYHYDHTA